MTPQQIRSIPTGMLAQKGTARLRVWLQERGHTMSLLDLCEERDRRGIRVKL